MCSIKLEYLFIYAHLYDFTLVTENSAELGKRKICIFGVIVTTLKLVLVLRLKVVKFVKFSC